MMAVTQMLFMRPARTKQSKYRSCQPSTNIKALIVFRVWSDSIAEAIPFELSLKINVLGLSAAWESAVGRVIYI